jgi:uncharacterized membrane protein
VSGSAPPPSSDPVPPLGPSPAPEWWRSPWLLLGLMIAAFTAVSCYAGAISYFDFQTRNSTDLTIFMQALTSTIRGHPAPFYESYDCMDKARCSFLLVHPSPALYVVVPFYALAPTPLTLFALQSVGVGLAAVPLYVLTRVVTGSWRKGLVAAGLFLIWAPTLGGEAFSFHLESFLPLALFTVAMLWALGRYRLGLVAALAAFLVLEIAPVFVFLIGALFLTYSLERILVSVRESWRQRRSGTRAPGPLRVLLAGVRSELGRRDVRYTVGLMVASVAAFVVLFLFMNVFGARLLGVPAPPLAPGLSGIFYENSSPGIQSLGTISGNSQWYYTAAFWTILYGLVAFVPLLAPRALIVSLPWIGYTFLTDTTRFVQIGSQYTLVAAVPVFIGVAYGMARVPIPDGPWATTRPSETAAGPPPPARFHWRRGRVYRAVWLAALVVVVVANVVIVPIDPLLSDLGVALSDPFQDGYQDHALTVLPGFPWAEQLAGQVPSRATVTAPSAVFSLFANYPHAFVLLGANSDSEWSALPLNLTGGPDDVLLYPSVLHALGHNFSANLTDPSRYGMEGWVGTTTVGPLMLYARGVTVPAILYGPPLPEPSYTWYPSDGGLLPGPVGQLGANGSAPYGTDISGPPEANQSGLVCTTPSTFVPPGTYSVRVLAATRGANLSADSRHDLLSVKLAGFGAPAENWTFYPSDFSNGVWTSLAFNVTFTNPVPALQLQGIVHADGFPLSVAAVSLQPSVES